MAMHVNDVGSVFTITVKDESGVVDLTTVEVITAYFQKPDKSIISRPCNTVDAINGVVRYTTVYGDFDQAGRWRVQVVVRFANGNVKHSDISYLIVEDNMMGVI